MARANGNYITQPTYLHEQGLLEIKNSCVKCEDHAIRITPSNELDAFSTACMSKVIAAGVHSYFIHDGRAERPGHATRALCMRHELFASIMSPSFYLE